MRRGRLAATGSGDEAGFEDILKVLKLLVHNCRNMIEIGTVGIIFPFSLTPQERFGG